MEKCGGPGGRADTAWQAGLARTWDDLARRHAGCAVLEAPTTLGAGGGGGAAGGVGGSQAAAAASAGAGSSTAAAGTALEAASSSAALVVPCLAAAVERIRQRAALERRLKSGRRVHVLVTGRAL